MSKITMPKSKTLIFLLLIVTACESYGKLKLKTAITNSLKEVSAIEIIPNSDIIWTIEDSGNGNDLLGLNSEGKIIRDIDIVNTDNNDWEDLTADAEGNIYIGDFGNNSKTRKTFRILKIYNEDLINSEATASIIEFTLPKSIKSKDFEAFFLYKNSFFIFSKENKAFHVFKVPNKIGKHTAILRSTHNFKGKTNKITSADISENGKTVVLLCHDKLWKLSNFTNDDFFSSDIEKLEFKHSSQKEGICFNSGTTLFITDEYDGSNGGNIYSFSIN